MGYFGDRVHNTIQIFKSTFKLILKYPKLLIPFLLMIIFSLVPLALIVIILFTSGSVALAFKTSMVQLIFLSIAVYFINTFFSAIHCWMVSRALKGQNPTFFDGFKRALANVFDVLAFAFVTFSVTVIAGYLRSHKGKGILGMIVASLMRSIAFMIEKGWEYSGYIVLPDMIISKRNFWQSLKTTPNILRRIPEYLSGGFAFDYIMIPVFVLILLFSALIFFLVWIFASVITALVTAVIMFFLLLLLQQAFYLTMKSTYFTVLYVELYEKGKLTTDFFKGLRVAKKELAKGVKEVGKGIKRTRRAAKKIF